jgi:CRISPR-associated protein Cmx8
MKLRQNQDLVTLEYRSSQLPSSQHRAGLAGLILKIQWLQEQSEFKHSVDTICKIVDLDAGKVILQFNLAGLTALLKSHYSASFEERESKKIRTKSKQNFRTIQREVYDADIDTTKLTNFYIYRDIVPQGYLVQSFEPPNSNNRVWTKLWQEATWTILRPRDRQRLPFKAMVSGINPPEIVKIWNLLRDRPDATVALSSTYMLGAQAKNNEGVPISDVARFYFLLNFWSYVAQIYLPIQVNAKDEVKLHGYAIAIPDVRNLAAFCQHFPSILRQRNAKELWGKPHSAIVRHSIEAGLNSLGSILSYLSKLSPELDLSDLLFGVDVFHLFRKKDEPQILSIQRYLPNREAIEEFTQLQDKIFDPIFRLQYWQNLIRDRPKIEGFYHLLRDLPTAKTIKNDSFCRDFRTVFHPKYNAMEQEKIDEKTSKSAIDSTETGKPTQTQEISIESLLLRLLKTYTRHQLKHRFGLEWNKKWDKQKPEILKQDKVYKDYKEKRQQIVVDLHHDFRRPRETNQFLAYFAGKFTDVYQYMNMEEYLLLAEQIQTQPEQIRILCLLALPVL